MNTQERKVSTLSDLQAAAADANVRQIVLTTPIGGMPTLRLSHGQTLTGIDAQAAVGFAPRSHRRRSHHAWRGRKSVGAARVIESLQIREGLGAVGGGFEKL